MAEPVAKRSGRYRRWGRNSQENGGFAKPALSGFHVRARLQLASFM